MCLYSQSLRLHEKNDNSQGSKNFLFPACQLVTLIVAVSQWLGFEAQEMPGPLVLSKYPSYSYPFDKSLQACRSRDMLFAVR
jgi:hypothetical protein